MPVSAVVAGLGYVGLPLAMRAVSAGELATALESGRFRLSADADACTGFDVAVVTVPTPLRDGLHAARAFHLGLSAGP